MPIRKEGRPRKEIDLSGPDGNAHVVIGRTAAIIKQFIKAGILPKGEEEAFTKRATSGDYENVLAVCREYVNWVDISEPDEDDEDEDEDEEEEDKSEEE